MHLIIDTKSHIAYTVFNDEKDAIEYKITHPNTEIVLLTHGIINEIISLSTPMKTDQEAIKYVMDCVKQMPPLKLDNESEL